MQENVHKPSQIRMLVPTILCIPVIFKLILQEAIYCLEEVNLVSEDSEERKAWKLGKKRLSVEALIAHILLYWQPSYTQEFSEVQLTERPVKTWTV